MSFSSYPEYNDSKVEWLGDVPAHWVIAQLKRSVIDCRNGAWGEEAAGDENDIAVVRVADFDRAKARVTTRDFTLRNLAPREVAGRLLQPGDLLLEKSGGGDKQLVGAVVLWENPTRAISANFIAKMTPRAGFDPRFLCNVHNALYAMRVNYRSIKQTTGIQNIDSGQYLAELVAFPPYEEQVRIAAFLDHETAKIDALIDEQKRLIELLKEKRQAVISHAVTKGLDPNAPTKDSGVEWLGEVPAHWSVAPLKRFWRVTDCKHVTAEFIDAGYPVASIREVQARYVDLTTAKHTTKGFYEQLIEEGRKPEPGNLLLSRNATVGEVAEVSPEHPEFALGQDVCLLKKLNDSFSSGFLYHYVRSNSVIEQFASMMVGATFKRVNVEEIRSVWVAMPPEGEQHAIGSFIDAEADQSEGLIAQAKTGVQLLEERRRALISAAVTGKIDVRGWQPPALAEPARETTRTTESA